MQFFKTTGRANAPVGSRAQNVRFGAWSRIGGRSAAIYWPNPGGAASGARKLAESLDARDLDPTVYLVVRVQGKDVWGPTEFRLGSDTLALADQLKRVAEQAQGQRTEETDTPCGDCPDLYDCPSCQELLSRAELEPEQWLAAQCARRTGTVEQLAAWLVPAKPGRRS